MEKKKYIMKNQEKIINEVKEFYELGLNYIKCDYNGQVVRFRINKDQARSGNNDGYGYKDHNLSLINVHGNGVLEVNIYYGIPTFESVFIQKQVWGVIDWEDAEREIRCFLDNITFSNKCKPSYLKKNF